MKNTEQDRKEDAGGANSEPIDILTGDDSKTKRIGEVFANDTSRQVLMSVFEGVDTANEIALKINLSLPLVSYHLKRLEQFGLIKVGYSTSSRKQKNINHYVPLKLALVLIPSSRVVKEGGYRSALDNGLTNLRRRLIPVLTGGATFASLYLIPKALSLRPGRPAAVSSQPTDVLSYVVLNLDLIGATAAAIVSVYIIQKLRDRREK